MAVNYEHEFRIAEGCDPSTRACLVLAAALPWYAVATGIIGLYFYFLLLVPMPARMLAGTAERIVTDILFAATLVVAAPLGILLLLAMPAGLVWAAFLRPPSGLAGRVVRGGCVVSMAFALFYAVLIVMGYVIDLAQDRPIFVWWTGWVHVVVLVGGLVATARSWRWLRRGA